MKAHIFQHKQSLALELGGSLPSLNVAYHTYGELNKTRDNVIWVCHALTASSEVEAWWPGMLGQGRLMDPEKHFIVCVNILGSCYGTTGPLSTNPQSGLPWYRSFPAITFRDLIQVHELIREHLGICRIHTLVGASIGAFQALEYSIMHPALIDHLVFIAGSVQVSPWAIAFNESQRLAIQADPSFAEDRPFGGMEGLKAARSIALLSYRNGPTYNRTQKETDARKTSGLKAASYQAYQGEKLLRRFDAYSYHALTRLMDTHHVARNRGSLGEALGCIRARVLCIGISSDRLFPPREQKLLAHVVQGSYQEIDSDHGHDGFLLEHEQLSSLIREFWQHEPQVTPAETPGSKTITLSLQHDKTQHRTAAERARTPA